MKIYIFLIIIVLIFFLIFFYKKITKKLEIYSQKDKYLKYTANEYYNTKEPIDIAITWVDSSDKHWQKMKEHYLRLKNDNDDPVRFPDTAYRTDTELKLSVQTILKFIPWIRYIWIVTQEPQIPQFIKLNEIINPKIKIIHHNQIFKNQQDLPTFNSHSIESNIHRIPGISNLFLYSNDDVYFTNYCYPYQFFTQNGNPIVNLELVTLESEEDTPYVNAWKTTGKILTNSEYFINKPVHTVVPINKKFAEICYISYKNLFDNTSSSKFRDKNDIPPIGFITLFCLENNLAFASNDNNKIKLKFVDNGENIDFSEKYDSVCINNVINLENLINIKKLL